MHWHWPLTASPQVRIAGQVQVTDAYLRGGPLYRNFPRSCSVVGVIGNVSGQTKICNLIRDNSIRSEWLSVLLTSYSTLHCVSIIQLCSLFPHYICINYAVYSHGKELYSIHMVQYCTICVQITFYIPNEHTCM